MSDDADATLDAVIGSLEFAMKQDGSPGLRDVYLLALVVRDMRRPTLTDDELRTARHGLGALVSDYNEGQHSEWSKATVLIEKIGAMLPVPIAKAPPPGADIDSAISRMRTAAVSRIQFEPTKRPSFNHDRADGPYDPCPVCVGLMSRDELVDLANDRGRRSR